MVFAIHQHESAIRIHIFPLKYVEIKQHNSEQPVDQRRNQKGNLKYLKTNENGDTTYHNGLKSNNESIEGKARQPFGAHGENPGRGVQTNETGRQNLCCVRPSQNGNVSGIFTRE